MEIVKTQMVEKSFKTLRELHRSLRVVFSKNFLNICRKRSSRDTCLTNPCTFTCKLRFSYRDKLHHLDLWTVFPGEFCFALYNLATFSWIDWSSFMKRITEKVNKYASSSPYMQISCKQKMYTLIILRMRRFHYH